MLAGILEQLLKTNCLIRLFNYFFDSWDDYVNSIKRIKKIKMNFPDLVLVPTHCSKTTDNLVSDKIDFHAL